MGKKENCQQMSMDYQWMLKLVGESLMRGYLIQSQYIAPLITYQLVWEIN